MKIAIGSDHGGYLLAQKIITFLLKNGHSVIQHLPNSNEDYVDYPDYAWLVAKEVATKSADFGILVCKTGIGMSITANKYPNIRAALCNQIETAKLSRSHNDANILCIGANFINQKIIFSMIETFLTTIFYGERHTIRIEKISNYEKNKYNMP